MAKKKTYQVKSGDSWFKIARNVFGDQRMAGALMDANPGVNLLVQGQVLHLPDQPSEDSEPVFFSNETAGRGLLANQGLIEAGGKPAGDKIANYAPEDLKAFFPAEQDYAKAMQLREAGQLDERQQHFYDQGFYTPQEEDQLAEEVAQLVVEMGLVFPEKLPDFDPLSLEDKTTLAAAAGKPLAQASSTRAQGPKDMDEKLEDKAERFGFEAEVPRIDDPTRRERLAAPRLGESLQEPPATSFIPPSMTVIEGLYNEMKAAQDGVGEKTYEEVRQELEDYINSRVYTLDIGDGVEEQATETPIIQPSDINTTVKLFF